MTIFVTGASRGIGRAIALCFAAAGHNVAICGGSDKAALDEAAAECRNLGADVLPLFADVADFSAVCDMMAQTASAFGKIDLLVNNAAISYIGFFADMDEIQWRRVVDVNLNGVINCARAALPIMLATGSGQIINISSVWGKAGASCEAVYSATKGGVDTLTRALAKELGPSGIRVNAVACGLIDTAMNNTLDEDEIGEILTAIPLGRLGKPNEIANAVKFLAGAEYITGEVITLDGGWC